MTRTHLRDARQVGVTPGENEFVTAADANQGCGRRLFEGRDRDPDNRQSDDGS